MNKCIYIIYMLTMRFLVWNNTSAILTSLHNNISGGRNLSGLQSGLLTWSKTYSQTLCENLSPCFGQHVCWFFPHTIINCCFFAIEFVWELAILEIMTTLLANQGGILVPCFGHFGPVSDGLWFRVHSDVMRRCGSSSVHISFEFSLENTPSNTSRPTSRHLSMISYAVAWGDDC